MNEECIIENATEVELGIEEIAEETSLPGIEETKPSEDLTDESSGEKEESKEDLEALRAELLTLRNELAEKKATLERMSKEIGEFSEIFPEKSVNSIPDSVWESVKAGIPLAAAYALYERKNAVRSDTAAKINERNNSFSTGAVGRSSIENFYTPDEVRAMSRSEVRKNYSKIIESMKKWN